jgi:hypothetical protein
MVSIKRAVDRARGAAVPESGVHVTLIAAHIMAARH